MRNKKQITENYQLVMSKYGCQTSEQVKFTILFAILASQCKDAPAIEEMVNDVATIDQFDNINMPKPHLRW